LFFFILLFSIGNANGKIKGAKSPQHSQFTDPPPIPSSFNTHCDQRASTLEEGILCFKEYKLQQATAIFNKVKKKAVAKHHRQRLLHSSLYLALIAIEQGKIDVATIKIKHLYFLSADFSLQHYGIHKKAYQTLFKTVLQRGRKLNDREIDDLSGRVFIRVTSCVTRDCKDGVWQPLNEKQPKNSIDKDIACSLNGNCVDDIQCAIAGTCN
jgi:hypothetical protein